MTVVQTAATVGNFGPGFDACSLALAGLGDRITIDDAAADIIQIDDQTLPTAWTQNVAGRTIDHLRAATGTTQRFRVSIEKGQPAGSGLGSSAASAGGAALAFHHHIGSALGPSELIAAASAAEGAGHADDVAAVILGGLALVRSGPGVEHRRIQPPADLRLAVLRPELQLLTRDMRNLVSDPLSLAAARHNIGATAFLIDAFHRGDVPAIGRALSDHIAAPGRKAKVPGYDDICLAAMAAGAHGVCLSGSGPALVAVADDPDTVAIAMSAACPLPNAAFSAAPEFEEPHVRLS